MPRSRSRSRSRSRERYPRRKSSSSYSRGPHSHYYKASTEGFYQTEHWPPFLLVGDSRIQSLVQICRTPPPHRWMPDAKTTDILEMVEEELKERGDEFEIVVIFGLQNDMLRYKKQKKTGERSLSANQYFSSDKVLGILQLFFAKMKSKYPHIVFILTLPFFFNFASFNRCRNMKVHVSAYTIYEQLQLQLRQKITAIHRQFQYLDLQRSYEIAQYLDQLQDPTVDGIHPTCSLAKRIMQGIYNSLLYAKKHHNIYSPEEPVISYSKQIKDSSKKKRKHDYSTSSDSSPSRSRSRSRERSSSKSPSRTKDKEKGKSTCYLYYRRSPSPNTLKKNKTLSYYNRGLKIELEEGAADTSRESPEPDEKERSRSRHKRSTDDEQEDDFEEDRREDREEESTKKDGFSIKGMMAMLEKLLDKLEMLTPPIVSFVKDCSDKDMDSAEAIQVLQSSEGKRILKMVLDGLNSQDFEADMDPTLDQARNWTQKLLDLAYKMSDALSSLDLDAIAEGTKGRESSYILDFIKTAFAYEGITDPPKELINKAYLKICSLHIEEAN